MVSDQANEGKLGKDFRWGLCASTILEAKRFIKRNSLFRFLLFLILFLSLTPGINTVHWNL